MEAGRPATRNEWLYMRRKLELRNGRHRFMFWALVAGAIVLGALGLFFLLARAPLLIAFAVVLTSAATGLAARSASPWLKGPGFSPETGILPLEGDYRREAVAGHRSPANRHFIGTRSFDAPAHWMIRLTEGRKLRAEAFFYPPLATGRGTMIAVPPDCGLVSLDGRYSVDREVECGLLDLRFPAGLPAIVLLAPLALMSAIVMLGLGLIPWYALERLFGGSGGESDVAGLIVSVIFLGSFALGAAAGTRTFMVMRRNRAIRDRIKLLYIDGNGGKNGRRRSF